MPKNCKHCGAEMPEEAHLCLTCLTDNNENAIVTVKKTNRISKKSIAAVFSAMLIIILIILIFCLSDKNSENSNDNQQNETLSNITQKYDSVIINDDENIEITNPDETAVTTEIENTLTNEEVSNTDANSITESENSWSEWSTEEPKKGTYSDIEKSTEYRYRTKITVTSYSTALPGYTQNGYTLTDDTSGTIDYVDEFPSGFDKSNAFYKEYNKSPKYTSETNTQKTNVSTEIAGYLYWHWAYPLSGEHSEDDRPVSDTYNEQIGNYGRATVFEAFQSDIPLNWNSQKLAFHCTGHSTYSYWWTAVRYDSSQQLQIKRCIWTTQNKLYNYYKISDWSEWNTEKPSNFYDMETRTVYRYKMN